MKTATINGKVVQVFCECDGEEWDIAIHTAVPVSQRCSECEFWPWVRRADLEES